jgi:uncharacterized lipoprotein YddW (UPF0748 family)
MVLHTYRDLQADHLYTHQTLSQPWSETTITMSTTITGTLNYLSLPADGAKPYPHLGRTGSANYQIMGWAS